jgi:hypothetical protein
MTQTKTALYDTRAAAEAAREKLAELGVEDSDISVQGADTPTGPAADMTGKDFWAGLAELFMPDEDRQTYSEGLRRGNYLLSVRVPEGLEFEVNDVLEAADPIDLNERSRTWRPHCWPMPSTAAVSSTTKATEAGDEVDAERTGLTDRALRRDSNQI